MKHKHAKDLREGDRFLMAGNYYRITDFYETEDPEIVKVAFVPIGDRLVPGRSILQTNAYTLFTTD